MYKGFTGEYAFLSNMYPCTVSLTLFDMPFSFTSAEACFQACKCRRIRDAKQIEQTRYGYVAKQLGRRVEMRANWNDTRIYWMKRTLLAKFEDPELQQKLVATYPDELIEHNSWGDRFWGVSGGSGENHLGKLLMEVRELYRDQTSTTTNNLKVYKVPVSYEKYGRVSVEAKDDADLIDKLTNPEFIDQMPLSDDDDYIEGSYEIDFDQLKTELELDT